VVYLSAVPLQAVDLDAAAQGIAQASGTYYTPAGCAVATVNQHTVNIVYTDCVGPLGTGSITGNVSVALTENQGALVLTATSSDLTIDGSTFVLDFQATATRTGNQRSVAVVSRSRDPSRLDERDATYTLTWEQGSGCVTANGTSSSTLGDLRSTSTLTDFTKCRGQCPSSGTVTLVSARGNFTTQFDGSSFVEVQGPRGNPRRYEVNCQ
jgi:hypothetical protein